MFKTATKIVLTIALGATPVLFTPPRAHAQTDAQQRAYQAGYNNGVNDRNQNKPLNLKTDNWHGANLSVYERGYEDGYRGQGNGSYYGNNGYGHHRDHDADDRDRDRDDERGYNNNGAYDNGGYYNNGGYVGAPGNYGHTDAERRAFQAGYQNGINDRRQNKPLNLKTDNWHGQNLSAYERGYESGYQGRGYDRH